MPPAHNPSLLPRRGPVPVEQHLAIALTTCLGFPAVWPSLKNGSVNWSPDLEAKAARLQKNVNLHAKNPSLDEAVEAASIERARQYIRGVKAYRTSNIRRDVQEMPVIWRQGTTRLLDYNPQADKNLPAVLCVPSLVNRFYILDLASGHSFLRGMAANGFRPLVVDWDAPGSEEINFSLEDYETRRLLPVLDFVNKKFGKPHLLGYCLGGILTLPMALMAPEKIRTLTLLATPWDYHKPSPVASQLLQEIYRLVEPGMEKLGYIPAELMNSFLSALQPLSTLQKFTSFAEMKPDSQKARDFVLLEDWLNDGVPLTSRVMRECIVDFYGRNITAKNEWYLGKHRIDPRRVTLPTYVCVPGKDYIVPPQSAWPLSELIPYTTLHQPVTGHIGMMASRSSPADVWTPLRHFWAHH
jgi:polyhydroxyalkanoate synthase subunit PhaC